MIKIAFVASEAVPFAKTGGLADVAGTLPCELEKLGCEVKLFIPKYFSIEETKFNLKYNWNIGEIPIKVAGHIRSVHILQSRLSDSNVEVNFVDCPHYFHRAHFYTNEFDEDERFILFSKGVIETLQRLNWAPDIIHCNDWQTGLIPLLLKDNYSWDKLFKNTSSIFTIHNIGYQGKFSKEALAKAEIDERYFYPTGPVEFYNGVSFLKAGISFADIITTVSKTYAKEILTKEYGAGMENVLIQRKESLFGIINGVDYSTWNPETDIQIPFNYSAYSLEEKIKNKKYLLKQFGMPFKKDVPLIGIVSRIVEQKGFDIFAEVINDLIKLNAQWIILGSGEEKFEDLIRWLVNYYPEKFGAYIMFSDILSHLVEAGSDMFLMPSRYEPCGLNQIYSLKYGSVPIVRNTGGLADTVHDWNYQNSENDENGTGFSFDSYSGYALLEAVQRAIKTFEDKITWKKIQSNGMKENFSWDSSANEYIKLYNLAAQKGK
ncbi:MAG: glycogen synthase GlgA [Ignavibacteriaceae bacterium]